MSPEPKAPGGGGAARARARKLAIALVHHPVLDAGGGVVTSALTNLDVHDLARSARTYGCDAFYVVHPVEAQRALAERIVDHWTTGSSGTRIPTRKAALALVRAVPTLEDAERHLAGEGGGAVERWVTAARALAQPTTFAEARARLAEPGPPVLLVFGTSWGLAASVTDAATVRVEPIDGGFGWNHLSVRAACAIALDRLVG